MVYIWQQTEIVAILPGNLMIVHNLAYDYKIV